MRYLNAFLLALAAPLLIAAADSAVEQRGELSAPQDHMVPFAWMVGEWQGEGWMLAPNGERLSFESQEIVSSRLSGASQNRRPCSGLRSPLYQAASLDDSLWRFLEARVCVQKGIAHARNSSQAEQQVSQN